MGIRAFLVKHFKPSEWAWWAGVLLVVSGVFRSAGWSIPVVSDVVRPVLDALTGTGDPGMMILLGLGYLGVHARLGDRK